MTNQETVASESPETASTGEATPLTHTYYEVGNDVLAKPGSLCDLIELHGCPSTAVFCNSPSDADLVDVVLKKRGINSEKLVGHVPPMRISKTVKQVKSGEISVVVLTDVSGQSIDTEELELVVNYSLPSEPEIYLHRCGQTRPGQKLKNVLSLINPLDLPHLHFLKKCVDFPIEKGELPSKEQLSGQTLKKLAKQAMEAAPTFDSRLTELCEQVLSDSASKEIVGLLLRNTLDVIPALQAAKASLEARSEGGRSEGGRGDRYDRNDRDGGSRGDRGGRNRRDRRHDDEGGSEMRSSEGGREGGSEGGYDRGERDDGGRRERRQNLPPPEKHHRLYIGEGTKNGLSKDKLVELIVSQANVQPEAIKNVKIRPSYTFVDVTEEASELVLHAFDVTNGKSKLFARRATTVSAPGSLPSSSSGEGSSNSANENAGTADAAPSAEMV